MPRTNIVNSITGAEGYQVPGAAVPAGWTSMNPSATSPAREAYTASLAGSSNPLVSAYNAGGNKPLTTSQIGEAIGSKPDYLSSYRNYLNQYAESLNETPEVTAAKTRLNEIQGAGEKQSLEARKAYEDIIHKGGGTKAGALEAGSVDARNRAYILANLGIAESGAARSLDALTGAQTSKQNYLKTLADLSKPMEVGENYVDPTTGEIIGSKAKSGIVGEYEYAKSQGYKGSFTDYQNEDANRKRAAAPKQTEAEKKAMMVSDVNEAVRQLGQIVKAKQFKGVSPDDYNTMRQYLQQTYGYEGVKELDSALSILGLLVDYGEK